MRAHSALVPVRSRTLPRGLARERLDELVEANRPRAGDWVVVTPSGPLSGVVKHNLDDGMVAVEVVVGEWMVRGAEPPLESSAEPSQDGRRADRN